MKKKQKILKKKKTRLFFYFLLPVAAILVFLIGAFFLYQSIYFVRKHNIDEKKLTVTKLPSDVRQTIPNTSTKSATFRLPILMYHYVEYVQDKNDTIRASLNIQPHIFEEQIKTLKDNGYTFLHMSEVGEIIKSKQKLPQKPIVLTFDDGYRDFYTDVLPIITKHKVKAVIYVVPGFLDKPNFLFISQLMEIAKNNLVEIGAHTMHHTYLKGSTLERATYETSQSKIELEKLLNRKVISFAYPYGAFDGQAIEEVKKAGFTTAVSTLPGIEVTGNNTYFLFRLRPGQRIGKALTDYLEQNQFSAY